MQTPTRPITRMIPNAPMRPSVRTVLTPLLIDHNTIAVNRLAIPADVYTPPPLTRHQAFQVYLPNTRRNLMNDFQQVSTPASDQDDEKQINF